MSYLEDIWDEENRREKERIERNMKHFESLSDEERFKLLWNEYVTKHCRD